MIINLSTSAALKYNITHIILPKEFRINVELQEIKTMNGWKQTSMTEEWWPLSPTTGSGGGLLLIFGYNSAISMCQNM